MATYQLTPAQRAHFEGLLPDLERYLRFAFRAWRGEQLAEFLQEARCQALHGFALLCERGRESLAYPYPLARNAVRAVFSGRTFGQPVNSKDAFARSAQERGAFDVLMGVSWQALDLETRRGANPADIVQARIDFSAWLDSLSTRDRAIAMRLAMGERTKDVASAFGLSPGRVSQLRDELRASWSRYIGDIIVDKEGRQWQWVRGRYIPVGEA